MTGLENLDFLDLGQLGIHRSASKIAEGNRRAQIRFAWTANSTTGRTNVR